MHSGELKMQTFLLLMECKLRTKVVERFGGGGCGFTFGVLS